MKQLNFIFLSLLMSMLILNSCKKKKDENPAPSGPSCTDKISQEVDVYSSTDSTTLKYKYDSNKRLVKIEGYYNNVTTLMSYDTLIYNGSGQLVTVNSYDNSDWTTPSRIRNFTYSNGNFASVYDTSNSGDAKTTSYTYNGSGVLTDMEVNYTSGTPGSDEPTAINNIVFTNGNITSGDATIGGVPGTAALTYETTAANPYKGMVNRDDLLDIFNANNVTNISFTVPGVGTNNVDTRSYQYSNGKVSKITSSNSGDSKFTYDCI